MKTATVDGPRAPAGERGFRAGQRDARGFGEVVADDAKIVGVASDERFETNLPQFDLSDYDGISQFILAFNGFK